ncbi:phosphoribosylaminoimidazolesuccinocarboxamide synthase [Candidatus Parvarchaeota archaeon]|nr:phosphoribosylaminoimidazolesuccinocarboxamide synthase [Candidatus Parvarchaeota archaeon]
MSGVVMTKTDLPLKLHSRGKVRDTYEYEDKLLMIASDRLSAFDVVFSQGIPYKGTVLTQLSFFWFEKLKGVIKNHLAGDANRAFQAKVPDGLPSFLAGRSMVVVKAKPLPIECVVRGYLAGSGLKDYNATGSVCGIKLPPGLVNSSKLPTPIFTPSTKATTGHDININDEEAAKLVGADIYKQIKEASINLYSTAADYAKTRGIILADTKFEFGIYNGELILIDEVLTPDSSRYWPADKYVEGKNQPSFDKQYARDYLEGIGWDKKPPAPQLPDEIIQNTSKKYVEAYELLTGKKFAWQ